MRSEDWSAVVCSVVFGLVGGFIAYDMKSEFCWIGAAIGAIMGFCMCEPQRAKNGFRQAREVYWQQKKVLLARKVNFSWRKIIWGMIAFIRIVIFRAIAFGSFLTVICSWLGIIGYGVLLTGLEEGPAFLVSLLASVFILSWLNLNADLDFSSEIAVEFFKAAFISSPITVLLYWLPHCIIPELLPVCWYAFWRAAKFFVNYLATHRAVLVALSIFMGVIVGRFCGHVLFCGGVSGLLCLAGILIRDLTTRSPKISTTILS